MFRLDNCIFIGAFTDSPFAKIPRVLPEGTNILPCFLVLWLKKCKMNPFYYESFQSILN